MMFADVLPFEVPDDWTSLTVAPVSTTDLFLTPDGRSHRRELTRLLRWQGCTYPKKSAIEGIGA